MAVRGIRIGEGYHGGVDGQVHCWLGCIVAVNARGWRGNNEQLVVVGVERSRLSDQIHWTSIR